MLRQVYGFAVGAGTIALLSRAAGAQQATKRDAQVAKDKKETAKATADAAKAQADAARATAEADKIKAETELAKQRAEAEAASRKRADDAAEADRNRQAAEKKRADDAAEAARVRDADAKARAEKQAADDKKFWLSLGTTAVGLAAGLLAGKFMGKAGAQAIVRRGNEVNAGLNELGAQAAKIMATTGKKATPIAGSVAGDAAKGIVATAKDLSKSKAITGKPTPLDLALPGLTLASGVAEVGYSFVAPNEAVAMGSRAVGTASIVASLAATKSLLTANRSIVRPGAGNLAALAGLAARLSREGGKVTRGAKAPAAPGAFLNDAAKGRAMKPTAPVKVTMGGAPAQQVGPTLRTSYVTVDGKTVEGTAGQIKTWQARRSK